MPRDLPLGNGRLLVNFDSRYRLRDFHYPRVGGENHSAGNPFRFGVWCDGQFGWVHDDDWERVLDYQGETLVTGVTLHCARMELTLQCSDAVDFHESIYLRRVRVVNRLGQPRAVRVFFSHNFSISDTEVGDTAYYHPYLKAILHYKGPRYFLIHARTADGSGIADYAIGYKDMPGREGTWRDAEGDGTLGKNNIAQGSVDSTIAVYVTVEPNGTEEFYYWICVAERYQDVMKLNELTLAKTPQALLRRTAAYWKLWADKDNYEFADLPESVVRLYKRSLLMISTQMDHGGAILAATDTDITQFNRDTYAYMWPRDGALVSHALDVAGFESLSVRFHQFCLNLLTREGFFLHKYNPDGSAGSSWHPWVRDGEPQLPIQEDETALVIWALWKHFDKFRDVENIKPLYRDLIMRAAGFMMNYMDETHGLPLPSYDLWEERRGVFAWTVGAVYGGLMAAANFAEVFGEEAEAESFRQTAARIREGCDRYLWSEQEGRFLRSVQFDASGCLQTDQTLDSSMMGLLLFGMYDPCDPRIEATVKALYDRLWVKTEVGGMARYENDYYHQVSQDISRVPGNPWFICTLWMAQYYLARAQSEEELSQALPLIQWVADHALPSGILAEQVDPFTHAPISVSPLTWSHATFVTTVIEYLDRKSELNLCYACGQPLFTKEREKLHQDRAHRTIHRGVIT
jgi:GH15 family glucan-1,4-alpha-glucosidase